MKNSQMIEIEMTENGFIFFTLNVKERKTR